MSTNYHQLAPSITSVRVEDTGGHKRLSIWINHALSGTLVFRKEEYSEFISHLLQNDYSAHVASGGKDVGMVVSISVNASHLPDDTILVSDSGEVTTLAGVKALQGQGKKS
jgi:hypothetical protein